MTLEGSLPQRSILLQFLNANLNAFFTQTVNSFPTTRQQLNHATLKQHRQPDTATQVQSFVEFHFWYHLVFLLWFDTLRKSLLPRLQPRSKQSKKD